MRLWELAKGGSGRHQLKPITGLSGERRGGEREGGRKEVKMVGRRASTERWVRKDCGRRPSRKEARIQGRALGNMKDGMSPRRLCDLNGLPGGAGDVGHFLLRSQF